MVVYIHVHVSNLMFNKTCLNNPGALAVSRNYPLYFKVYTVKYTYHMSRSCRRPVSLILPLACFCELTPLVTP